MPMSMLKLKPGVNVELTPSQLEAGYAVSNLGRFRNGLFEKLGGWLRYFQFAVGGVPKALHAWLDLNENKYLGVGTTTVLGAITDNQLVAITPQTLTTDFAPDFDTVNATPNVIVSDSNVSNVTNYDSVEFLTPVSVGGLILSGLYPVDAGLGGTTYRIVADVDATATVASGGAVPSFATTSGSQTVTVTLADHGLSVGDTINLPVSTTVGGVVILGTYTALTVPTSSTFTIAVDGLATSSTSGSMNGGNVRLRYYIALGPVAAGSGYSVGLYSDGGYSTGASGSSQTGTPLVATDYSLDNWGQTLLACPEGDGIYQWTPGTGLLNAQLIGTAPAKNTGLFVATEIQIAIAYGSTSDQTIGLDQDPLLARWSNQGDFTDWSLTAPAGTSQAGQRRLSTGSRIVGGMAAPQFNLLWTDIGLWAMQYQGVGEGVFGFNPIGYGCGLIGKHAVARLGANIFWMSQSNFYVLGGGAPQVIPCTVWDTVFQDLNTANNPETGRPYSDKSWAWANTPFNEIWFFFPRASTGATEPDCYVKYNTLDNLWDETVMPFDRTAGINQSILGMPIAASSQGLIYEHEVSPDGDGQPINSFFQSGIYRLSEGQEIAFVDWWFPDMKWTTAEGGASASVQMTIFSQYYLSDTPQVHGPFTVTSATGKFSTRIRGRFLFYTVGSNDLGSWWRFGSPTVRIAPDGRL